jgi:hypothetical protein
LEQEISAAANGLDKPLDDEFKESRLPEKVAPAYRAMYAYGMHLRIKSAKEEKITSDIGVAFAVWWRSRGWTKDKRSQLESVEYIGWIEEILELDYRNHYYIVLVCSWIPRDMNGLNAKVVHNIYGFVVGNFIHIVPLGLDSFPFPMQCI